MSAPLLEAALAARDEKVAEEARRIMLRREAERLAQVWETQNTDGTATGDEDARGWLDFSDEAFWDGDDAGADWLVDGLFQRGQQVVVYSLPGHGKSLLTLECAALLATGQPTLGGAGGRVDPIDVLYLDHENSQSDVRARLRSFGFGPHSDLSRLHYSLLGSWPRLNTAEGGEALVEVVKAKGIELVVIDTTSRVVDGDINHSATITELWRHTQVKLKRLGVTVIRIDHSGKNADRGQLGTVMKSADQDVIWRLARLESDTSIVELVCEKDRAGVIEVGSQLHLTRSSDPLRHHVLNLPTGELRESQRVDAMVTKLDALGVPNGAGRDKCKQVLKGAEPDFAIGTQTLMSAISVRRSRSPAT